MTISHRAVAFLDMPDRPVDLLFRFLRQNNGGLSQRARDKEFAKLRDPEVASIEEAYAADIGAAEDPERAIDTQP